MDQISKKEERVLALRVLSRHRV